MNPRPLAIIGAGGHGREVLDVVRAINAADPTWDFVGFVAADEPDADILGRLGARWLGTLDDYLRSPLAQMYVAGIGDGPTRRRVVERIDARGLQAVTLVHPTVTVGADTEMSEGTVLFPHVSITTNVRLGRHVHVNRGSTIGHDCLVGDFVTAHPLAALSGAVNVGPAVTLGAHSCVLQGLQVGAEATVGAGAVVTHDVGSGTTVVGVPARPLA